MGRRRCAGPGSSRLWSLWVSGKMYLGWRSSTPACYWSPVSYPHPLWTAAYWTLPPWFWSFLHRWPSWDSSKLHCPSALRTSAWYSDFEWVRWSSASRYNWGWTSWCRCSYWWSYEARVVLLLSDCRPRPGWWPWCGLGKVYFLLCEFLDLLSDHVDPAFVGGVQLLYGFLGLVAQKLSHDTQDAGGFADPRRAGEDHVRDGALSDAWFEGGQLVEIAVDLAEGFRAVFLQPDFFHMAPNYYNTDPSQTLLI